MKKQNKIYTAGLLACITIAVVVPTVNLYVPEGSYWTFGGSIVINDSVPLQSWAFTKLLYSWCSGSGTIGDPYLIENITLTSGGIEGFVIMNSVAYFILRNITITGKYNGIRLTNVQNGQIYNCSVSSCTIALLMQNADNNLIFDNNFNSNSEYGIEMEDSDSNWIPINQINNNVLGGIVMDTCIENWVFGNEIKNTQLGIGEVDSSWNWFDFNTIDTISSLGIWSIYCFESEYKFNNISNALIGGIGCWINYNQLAEGNRIYNSGFGIAFADVWTSAILDNKIYDNTGNGIWFEQNCDENVINNTLIDNNGKYGILLEDDADDINVTYCNITNNALVGLLVNGTSDSNLIYLNNFINNGINAQDDSASPNSFDNGTIGNYWDDYSGIDSEPDGIGDTPYAIGGTAGSQDNYPIFIAEPSTTGGGISEEPNLNKDHPTTWDDFIRLFTEEPDGIIFLILLSIFGITTALYITFYLRKRKNKVREITV